MRARDCVTEVTIGVELAVSDFEITVGCTLFFCSLSTTIVFVVRFPLLRNVIHSR